MCKTFSSFFFFRFQERTISSRVDTSIERFHALYGNWTIKEKKKKMFTTKLHTKQTLFPFSPPFPPPPRKSHVMIVCRRFIFSINLKTLRKILQFYLSLFDLSAHKKSASSYFYPKLWPRPRSFGLISLSISENNRILFFVINSLISKVIIFYLIHWNSGFLFIWSV